MLKLPIIITVSPSRHVGEFEARHRGRLLAVSREPLCAGSRRLLDLGFPVSAAVVMMSADTGTERLRSTIGVAAKLTVAEGNRGAPRFRRWKAMPLREGSPPIAPLRNSVPIPPEGAAA